MASTIKLEQKVEFFDIYYDFDQEESTIKINNILKDGWIIKGQISIKDTTMLVIFEKQL